MIMISLCLALIEQEQLLESLYVLQMGDRVGPVGTGEASSSMGATGGTQRLSPVNWSMLLDRQEALVSTDADTHKCQTEPLMGILTSCIVYFSELVCDTVK